MSSKISQAVGRKWLAFVIALVGIALVCLTQPALIEKMCYFGLVLGIVYITWQGIDDIVEKHYDFKTKELGVKKSIGPPKVT